MCVVCETSHKNPPPPSHLSTSNELFPLTKQMCLISSFFDKLALVLQHNDLFTSSPGGCKTITEQRALTLFPSSTYHSRDKILVLLKPHVNRICKCKCIFVTVFSVLSSLRSTELCKVYFFRKLIFFLKKAVCLGKTAIESKFEIEIFA